MGLVRTEIMLHKNNIKEQSAHHNKQNHATKRVYVSPWETAKHWEKMQEIETYTTPKYLSDHLSDPKILIW